MDQVALEFSPRNPSERPLEVVLVDEEVPMDAPKAPAPSLEPKKVPEVFTPIDRTKLRPKTQEEMLADFAALGSRHHEARRGAQEIHAPTQRATSTIARVQEWLEDYKMTPATGKMHLPQIAQDLNEPLATIQKALNELQERARWKK